MSVANILNNDPLGKQIDQPNLTVDNLLTVKDINCSGVINATTLAVDNLSLYTQQTPYTGDSATLNYQNADFSLGKITGLDTSVPPNGTYYSKIQVKPQINDTTPEMFFVGRDANPDNTTRQLGAFVRSRKVVGAGAFTSEARLGLTNVEPDGIPAVTVGETYAFRLPPAGGSDILTLTAFDNTAPNTAPNNAKDLMTITPSGARPYQSYAVALGDTSTENPVVQVQGSDGLGYIYDNKYNIPRAMVIPQAEDATFGSGFTLSTPSYLAPFIATNSAVLNSTTGQIEFALTSANLSTAPYMLQVVIDCGVAGTVLTPGEAFGVRMFDNIAGGQTYFGGDITIQTTDMSLSPPAEAVYNPTRKFVFSSVVWVNKEQTVPTVPDPIIAMRLRGASPNTSTSSLPIGAIQIAFFPMMSQ
jgi:hypothetical protein